jgi:hypothetical protein
MTAELDENRALAFSVNCAVLIPTAPERAGGLRAGQALLVRTIIVRTGRRALVQRARGQFGLCFSCHESGSSVLSER